jgi:beta-N-acetylglucosaminidase
MEENKKRQKNSFDKLDFLDLKLELKNKLITELNKVLKENGFLNNKGTFLENS